MARKIDEYSRRGVKSVLLAVCGLVMCACSSDEDCESPVEPGETFTISIRAQPVTRTQLGPDGMNLYWSPGDRIGVYIQSDDALTTVNAPLTFVGSAAASPGVFRGEVTLKAGAAGYTLYAYYPYAEQAPADASAVPFTLATAQVQADAGSSAHLGAYDFMVAGAVQSTTSDFPTLMFRNAFSLVEVDLTGTGAMAGKQLSEIALYCSDVSTVDASGNLTGTSNMAGAFRFDLTAPSGNNTAVYEGGMAQINFCRLNFTTPPTLGAAPLKAYLTVNPGDYSRGGGQLYVVARTTDGYTATYTLPGPVLAAGQVVLIARSVDAGVAPQTIDLTAEGPTANCYIASAASQEYVFDAAVAGNGFIPQALAAAVERYEGRALSAGLAGTTARLLWQSQPHLIDPASVAYDGSRIRFSLTTRPTVLGGNAVIGLYASDDPAAEAVWSWHIWITDKNNAELTAVAETYILFAEYEQEYGPGSVQMMDRNLGAVYKEDGPYARSFRAPLYQWGRKDPMPWGRVVFDAQDIPHIYLLYYQPVLSTGALGQYSGFTGNTYYATAHPETFVTTSQGSSFDWYYGGGKGNGPDYRNNELWGNPLGYQVGQKTTKTLFDPCPPGWVMPHPYAFSGFTKSGNSAPANDIDASISGTFVQGWNFYYSMTETTFYPGVGYRYDEFGLFDFSPSAYYWTSSPAADTVFGAMFFGMTSANIYQRVSDPRGFGLPVRCMRDLPTL